MNKEQAARLEGVIPPPGTVVTVHKNLNRERQGNPAAWVISIAGKVTGYVERVALDNATPRYRNSNFEAIGRTGHRQVYARIIGTISADQREAKTDYAKVRCNPHRRKEFHLETGEAFQGCARAEFPVGEPYFLALGRVSVD